jgi:hypothetical protein
MMMRVRSTLTGAVALGSAALGLAAVSAVRRQARAISEQRHKLIELAAGTRQGDIDGIDDLPSPVARYLRWCLDEWRPLRLLRIAQRGTLRTDVHSGRWMPFTADQLVAPAAAAFLWDAHVRMGPLLHVRVRDAFIEGRGSGHASLLSAFTVSSAAGTPEMNAGSLHRFLAEAVWYPTALLPSPYLRWRPLDDSRAVAEMSVHDVSVSLEFRFADTGEVTGIYTPARWGTFPGGFAQRGWEGHFRTYRTLGGVRVPTEADVGWYDGDGWQPVWQGTITEYMPLATGRARS